MTEKQKNPIQRLMEDYCLSYETVKSIYLYDFEYLYERLKEVLNN